MLNSKLSMVSAAALMLSPWVGYESPAIRRSHAACSIHATRIGPGRSKGMKRKLNSSGYKLAKKSFEGNCTLRTGVGAAGRMALEGKLNAKPKL